jgi:hypothetical protein
LNSLRIYFSNKETVGTFQDDILEIINERKAFEPVMDIDTDDDEERESCEYSSQMPPVGTRVRRGPDWQWGCQDMLGTGTVVSHAERGNCCRDT